MDVVLGSVCEEVYTSLELLKELGVSPRGDGLDCSIESNCAHFKANLVVAFARGSMRYVLRTFCLGDSNLCLGDKRAGDRGSKKITTFVDGIALHSGKNEV